MGGRTGKPPTQSVNQYRSLFLPELVLHYNLAILVSFAALARCAAAGDELSYFKEFTSHTPSNLVLRFESDRVDYVLYGSNTVVLVDSNNIGQYANELQHQVRYHLLVLLPPDFLVLGSDIPLNMGYQKGASFTMIGKSNGSNWVFNSASQITYFADPTNDHGKVEYPAVLDTYSEIERMLSLGIDARESSLQWQAESFAGDMSRSWAKEKLYAGTVKGELKTTNGLPSVASYEDPPRAGMVYFTYASRLDLPVPSLIRVDIHNRVYPGNTNKFVTHQTTFQVAECRPAVADDHALIDPHYWIHQGELFAQTASESELVAASNTIRSLTGADLKEGLGSTNVTEYLSSNGVVVAKLLTNGGWQRQHAPRPAAPGNAESPAADDLKRQPNPRPESPGGKKHIAVIFFLIAAAGSVLLWGLSKRGGRRRS
jgi:hypothetical protein